MGTLFSQPERPAMAVGRDNLDIFLTVAKELSRKHGISIETVIAAKHALELERQNNLYHYNGDTWDEQMKGIGECLVAIAHSIDAIAEREVDDEG